MQIKTDALLLRAVNFGESDKIVTLLGAEGKLTAGMRGVRKAGAKLGFAAQPFCFAEYVLARRGSRNTVISASLHDGFFSLSGDIRSFYAAGCITEACDKLCLEGMEGGPLLVEAVSALGSLAAGGGSGAVVRFFVRALALAGYALRADALAEGEKLYFDMERGAFCLSARAEGVRVSVQTYRSVRFALGLGGGETEDGNARALRLLGAYFAGRTDTELGTLNEYLRLARRAEP